MSESDLCSNELSAANNCLQVSGDTACECYEDINDFPTSFPSAMRVTFSSAQAFALPSDPFFCDTANARVCGVFKSDFACCCQDEVEAYRKCLFNKVLVPSIPTVEQTCEDSCSWNTITKPNEGGSGGGTAAAITCVLLLLAACGAGYWYIKRKKQRNGHDNGDTASDNVFMNKLESFRTFISSSTQRGKNKETVERTNQDIERGMYTSESVSDVTTISDNCHGKHRKDSSSKQKSTTPHCLDDNEGNAKSKTDHLRHKRDAIENWVVEKKNGSNRSLQDYLEDEEGGHPELVERKSKKDKSKSKGKSRKSDKKKSQFSDADSKASKGSIVSDYAMSTLGSSVEEQQVMKAHLIKLTKHNQELKENLDRNKLEEIKLAGMKDKESLHRRSMLTHDSEKMKTELSDLEATKAYYEGCLRAAKDESVVLGEKQDEAMRLIARLEAQNEALVKRLQSQEDSTQGMRSDRGSVNERGRDRAARERSRSRNRLDGCDRSRSKPRLDGSRTRLDPEEAAAAERSRSRNRLDGCSRSRSRPRLNGERSHSRTRLDSEDNAASAGYKNGDIPRARTKRRGSARGLQRSSSNRSMGKLEEVQHRIKRRGSDRDLTKHGSSRDMRYNSSYSKVSELVDGDPSWGHASLKINDLYNNY